MTSFIEKKTTKKYCIKFPIFNTTSPKTYVRKIEYEIEKQMEDISNAFAV